MIFLQVLPVVRHYGYYYHVLYCVMYSLKPLCKYFFLLWAVEKNMKLKFKLCKGFTENLNFCNFPQTIMDF